MDFRKFVMATYSDLKSDLSSLKSWKHIHDDPEIIDLLWLTTYMNYRTYWTCMMDAIRVEVHT